jgi:hypothetical protein
VGADLGAEPVLERGDDPATVRVVLRVGRGHHQDVQRQPQDVAADLDVPFLHHVEQRHLDPLRQVRQLVQRHDPTVGPRDQPVVDGLRVAQPPALRDPHRIDVADHVRHGRVRGRELLHVALAAVAPLDRQPVPLAGDALAGGIGDRGERVLAQLRTGHHGRPLVQQADQGAQQAGLALPALAQQHDVVAGDDRPLELGDDGRGEAVHSRPRVPSRRERIKQVVPQLLTQSAAGVSGGTQLAEGSDVRCGAHVTHGSRAATLTLPA